MRSVSRRKFQQAYGIVVSYGQCGALQLAARYLQEVED
jgi:hypothetical protein